VDRLVLSSAPDGEPAVVAARGAPRSDVGATVEVRSDHRGNDYDLSLSSDGAPFWLVLGQSDDRGWDLDVDGGTAGPREIVDGYANGWLITPDGPGEMTASLRWGPQRLVWITLALSALGVAACLVILVRTRRRPVSESARAALPTLATWPAGRRVLTPGTPGLAVAVGMGVLLVATPMAAVVASAAVVIGLLVPRVTWVWAVLAPVLVLAARGLEHPELAWVALALLASDLVAERWTARSVRARGRGDRRAAPAP
jgi:arabinofuranan 3-O-arabinosyltransferase